MQGHTQTHTCTEAVLRAAPEPTEPHCGQASADLGPETGPPAAHWSPASSHVRTACAQKHNFTQGNMTRIVFTLLLLFPWKRNRALAWRQKAIDHLQKGRVDKLVILEQEDHLLGVDPRQVQHLHSDKSRPHTGVTCAAHSKTTVLDAKHIFLVPFSPLSSSHHQH